MQARKPSSDTVVVDFSRGALRLARAETAGDAVRFHEVCCLALPLDEDEGLPRLNAPALVERLRRQVQRLGWEGLPAACLLPGWATSTQSFDLPSLAEDDARRAIALRLVDTLHFELNEAVFAFRQGGADAGAHGDEEPGSAATLVAAARTDAVRQAVEALEAAGLHPVAVGAAAESLANLSQCISLWGEDTATIHVDLGAASTILNLFEGNCLRFSREIDLCEASFVDALLRPILCGDQAVQLDENQAVEVLRACGFPTEECRVDLPHGVDSASVLPLLDPVGQRLAGEVGRSVDYLSSLLDRDHIDRIVLSGTSGRMVGLDRFLGEALGVPVEQRDPVERAMAHWRLAICGDAPLDLAGFAPILGYSLGARRPINLLPREVRVAQQIESIGRLRRAVVLPAIAASVILAAVGLPIRGEYAQATERLEAQEQELDGMLDQLVRRAEERATATGLARIVRDRRGVLPPWTALFRELGALAPPEIELELLEVNAGRGGPELHLVGRMHRLEGDFEAASARWTDGLSASPFLRGLQVIESTAPSDVGPGRFEALIDLLADGREQDR